MPCSSAAWRISSSRIEPPGWITAVTPPTAATSTPSRNGKNASLAMTEPCDRSAAFRNRPPWNLMPRWVEHEKDLELETPLDFVCTADIIGGNSGSPVVNKDGEFVGIIFDGNIESLALDYYYTDEVARAVSVDARAIVEALRKVYGTTALVDELAPK